MGKMLPDYKFLIPVYKGSYTNPYGTGLLSKCYWPVTFKNGGLRFWATYMERYGMPTVLGRYERGSTMNEAQELAAHLSEMSQDSVIVAPSDVSLQMVEANRHGSVELYSKMIENCNSEISKAILSQTLTTEIDAGSRAAAEIHYRVRGEIIESDMRFVKAWIKKLYETIIEVNRLYG
jgi:phage gp29-like protein